jgi:lysophospholipase L1-like esterase
MLRRRRDAVGIIVFGALGLAACADQPVATAPSRSASEANASGVFDGSWFNRGGSFERYVAIGTSVSMGVGSDGVFFGSQEMSWPAQLARQAGTPLTIPGIAAPGCGAPLAGPLAAGVRISGEPAGRPGDANAICASNLPGVTLPERNVAVDGARTSDALFSTTETYAGTLRGKEYERVLPPKLTQISAMLLQRPTLVSVELGANELLGVRNGLYAPGNTVVPIEQWKPLYRLVVAAVAATRRPAVLVGLVSDAGKFPSFRTGLELWNARATFAPFNVTVAEDCGTTNSTNVLFVAVRVPVAVGNGVARARAGLGPYTLSCVNAPSSTGIEDYVLTAEEIALVNQQLNEMSAFIRQQAHLLGYAYFELESLYGRPDAKGPFNAITLMTHPTQPYGPYFSLDGLHPSAEGHRILADAAAAALNERYGFGIPLSAGVLAAVSAP